MHVSKVNPENAASKDAVKLKRFEQMIDQKEATGIRVEYHGPDGKAICYLNPLWPVPEYINKDTLIRFDKLSPASRAYLDGTMKKQKKGGKR